MKNKLIIFSKNRACQLHLALESIKLNGSDLFDRIEVIYKADQEYKTGYEILMHRMCGQFSDIIFTEETSFNKNLMDAIDEEFEFTTFLVDDTILFRPITSKAEILGLMVNDVICFSLRLGLNCEYSHPANLSYKIGEYFEVGDYITFDFTTQAGDFAYPLSVDGHIFKTVEIKKMISIIPAMNPNLLEASIQRFIGQIPKHMTCFKESKLVGVPVNLVNEVFKNRNGLEHPISHKALNHLYLAGEIIDMSALDFSTINGPHKEIKYNFKNY